MLPEIDSLWDFNDAATTETRFRALLPECQTPELIDYRVELLTQIARTLGLQRKFDEAHLLLDEAINLHPGMVGRQRMRVLLERGRLFNSARDKDAAKPLFIEAWELGKFIKEEGLAVDAAHMVAIAAPAEALEWNLQALALAEASSQPAARKWRKSLYNNLGWTFFDMRDHDKALHYFELSRQAAEESGDKQAERIARWSLAKTYRMKGETQKALDLQRAQLQEAPNGPYVHEEIAECLNALGSAEEAKPYFARAHELLSQDIWLQANEPERLKRLAELAGGN